MWELAQRERANTWNCCPGQTRTTSRRPDLEWIKCPPRRRRPDTTVLVTADALFRSWSAHYCRPECCNPAQLTGNK
jgi:hypothetical protein